MRRLRALGDYGQIHIFDIDLDILYILQSLRFPDVSSASRFCWTSRIIGSRSMLKTLFCCSLFVLAAVPCGSARADTFQRDTVTTTAGNVEIAFIGHGSLMLVWNGKVIHVDPFSKLADYSTLPSADLILVTHHHGDHFDPAAIEKVSNDKTKLVLTAKCAETLKKGVIMTNGDMQEFYGMKVEAVPAYNLVHLRPEGGPFHPKGEGNGYIVTIGKTRIYIAGDTENTPEMKALKDIDLAFLPMNLPYTMTPEMVADAAKAFKPKILYPYHFGESDTSLLLKHMKGTSGVDVRIRNMK
jgi:L-ascorbate metabolism protein UlaG (beta-lactamase superfamily)